VRARAVLVAVAFAAMIAPPAARADHLPGHSGSIFGPRNGTGTNFHPRQPHANPNPYDLPRRPDPAPEMRQYVPPNHPWNQPRKPDLYPWGKPKY